MVVWLILLALVSGAEARVAPEVGIGENNDTLFADPLFASLDVRHVRVVVSYDVIARADDELGRVDRYLAAAQAHGAEPLVTFEHSRGDARGCPQHPRRPQCRLPTAAEYEQAFLAFRARFPQVRTFAPWNEPNHRTQPTWNRPEAAARLTNIAARHCQGCTIVVGDLLDQADNRLARQPTFRATTRWVRRYRAALRTPRAVCGIHNYADVNRFRTAGTRALIRALGCERYWLTETGGIMSSGGLRRDPQRQTRATRFLFELVDREPLITRAYVYTWFGRVTPQWDSGLVARRADGTTAPRPALAIVREHIEAGTPRPTTIGKDIEALARDALRSWAESQTPEGLFPNPVAAEVAAGHGGFSPPMLTYALQRAGWTVEAARAWPMSVSPARASPFDMIGAAHAARAFGVPLEGYIAAYAPKYTGRYNNLKLVEAVAAVLMTEAGVPSPWLDEALRTLNETVPQYGRPLLRAGTIRGAYLSDPNSHPLAYHALSALMLTQVAHRLGPAARRTLAETLEALSVLVAPDGAADYFGRGQGNVWAPAVTVAAMVEGAALYPQRAGRYLAVAEAALARLRAVHLTPDRGLLVVPGERVTSAGIDAYVHTVAYNGLALWALAVAAERAATLGPVVRGALPAAAPLQVSDRRSGLAVTSTGRTWLAVRAVRRGINHDLRSGFGLLALKVREGDRWRDLLAPRPLFKGTPVTPAPLLGARNPGGTNVRTAPGAISIRGSYGRGPVRFGFRALPGGAELTVAPVRAGERYRLLVFTPAGTGDRSGAAVVANGARWRFNAPITVRREPGWHSGPVENLDALRVEARPRGGRLTIRISAL
ncbi:MAG TPA: hypothetical protein VFZ00_14570 [Solirubrobacter sp.]|nr:hypothetical protein [Solirubrobacter sp.]